MEPVRCRLSSGQRRGGGEDMRGKTTWGHQGDWERKRGRRISKHWSQNSSASHGEDYGETNSPLVMHKVHRGWRYPLAACVKNTRAGAGGWQTQIWSSGRPKQRELSLLPDRERGRALASKLQQPVLKRLTLWASDPHHSNFGKTVFPWEGPHGIAEKTALPEWTSLEWWSDQNPHPQLPALSVGRREGLRGKKVF